MAYFSLAARLGGDPVTVDTATWEHGVSLRAGQVVGSSATVKWTDGAGVTPASQVPHPLRPGWSRTNGTPCSLDLTVDGTPRRVFTGQVEDASGSLTAGSSSRLTDHAARLDTAVEVPPIAYTMPARNLSSQSTALRRVGLFGTYITQLVMAQAGFHTCQPAQSRAVWYQSMAGSVWTAADPSHVTGTLGIITTAHRLGDPTTAPQVVQGTYQPCMEQVYTLGSTSRRRPWSSVTAWQLTVDMASDSPTVAHAGRVDVRTLPQSAGAGVRLEWDHSNVRVYRRNTDGSTVLLGTAHRAVAGDYSMRWSLIVRPGGTATLHADNQPDALQIASHGVGLPSGPDAATVIVESEGPCGAVQVTRSDDPSIAAAPVNGRIYRSSFQNRSLPGFDYRPPTSAAHLLVEQANAERSLLGMPLWLWIDRDGHLVNADPAWLAAQPVSRHFSTHGTGTPLTGLAYAIPPSGPHQRIDVIAKRGYVTARRFPTVLLYEGRQKNHDHGDDLGEFLHPEPDTTWLEPDMRAYLAGRPYPNPPFPPATQHEFNRAVGSWVGGMLLDEDGSRLGWIEPQHVDGWSIDAFGHVNGVLEAIDHRTIHHKGTFVGGSSRGMSSMPDQGSSTLWAHRAMQALPQIRGGGRIDWTVEVEQVVASGDATHPVLEHDTGMWCQTGTWRRQIGEALAQASLVPPVEVTLTVGLDPDVTVGDRISATVTYPDGARLEVDGLVAGVKASAPSAEMEVRLVLLAHSWTDPSGVEYPVDHEVPPPPREVLPPKDRVPPPTDPGQEGGGLL